ncbi:MAG: hypothetical protein IIB77_01915, partial [Proteobacteria bacterium]|nr:hypothetical protein [Pseudomonadota bacterium]
MWIHRSIASRRAAKTRRLLAGQQPFGESTSTHPYTGGVMVRASFPETNAWKIIIGSCCAGDSSSGRAAAASLARPMLSLFAAAVLRSPPQRDPPNN